MCYTNYKRDVLEDQSLSEVNMGRGSLINKSTKQIAELKKTYLNARFVIIIIYRA